MNIRSTLPSAQFTLVVVSLAVAGGLVLAAERYSRRELPTGQLAAGTPTTVAQDTSWQDTLAQIQAENPGLLPPPPPEEVYQAFISEARSGNLTDTVSRTLFVNLSNAGIQGLGSDIPTQDQLVAAALQELDRTKENTAHAAADLAIVNDSPESLRAYGNAVIAVLQAYPAANVNDTYFAIGSAVDHDDRTYFDQLTPIERAYRQVAEALLATPVPRTLSPLHLAVANNFFNIADTYPDMRAMPEDSLRGLAGLYRFQALTNETRRMFTTIAQQLQQNAILFAEDEPGSAWSAFTAIAQ